MSSQPHTIRDFAEPPVIETVLSVQFAPLPKLSIGYFGLYWEKIRSEFTRTEVRPPLGHIREQFGRNAVGGMPQFGFEVLSEPLIRCWFLDKPGNQILQVQKDHFVYNWQKVSGNETYPRYENVRAKFEQEWRRFHSFLEEHQLGTPEINQCEVTYVNHIEYDVGWKSFGELNKVISCWSGSYSGTFLPAPERVNLNVVYLMPDNLGRLHVSLIPVIRARDAKEVLQLNLTARGAPSSSGFEDIFEWIDTGRKWVVEGFTDFTTKAMHQVWGRTK